MVALSVCGHGARQGRDRQRAGRCAVRGRRRGGAGRLRLAPGARGLRDQGRVRRRGRPGPGAGALPPLGEFGARRAGRLGARVEHQHHRGLHRGLPRRGQQAPRRNGRRPGRRRRSSASAPPRTFPSPMPTFRIASIGGDGVGPEVIAAARLVLDAVGARDGLRDRVAGRRGRRRGHRCLRDALRAEDLAAVGSCDAILLGAVGGPRWDDPDAKVRPEQALFALRGGLELFANLGPSRSTPRSCPRRPSAPSSSRAWTC